MSMNCSGCEYDGFIYWKEKKVSYCKYFKQTKRNMDEIKIIPYHHFQHGWCPHDTRQEEKSEETQ